jgi:hypothetical protein
MTTLASIFRQAGPAYRARFGQRLLPSHRRAMRDIEACRTAALGGQTFYCDNCEQYHYSYHACRNRHCPQCQNEVAQTWLANQQACLLKLPYFMLTFTLPEALRPIARANQRLIYQLLFRCSAQATQKLARDPRFVGGQIGMIGVLQTWTRDLRYHPHIHYLIPAAGLDPDQPRLHRTSRTFLVALKPLALIFRAKFKAALQRTGLFAQVPASVWRQNWVVHCQPVGHGRGALKYLAPYIFRVAIANNRILTHRDGEVTFRFDTAEGQPRTCTLPVFEFIRRFLQHVLPKGFKKVRYFGFFAPGCRAALALIRHLLHLPTPTQPPPPPPSPIDRPCPVSGKPLLCLASL